MGAIAIPHPKGTVRTTIEIPEVLDRNLEIFCAVRGVPKKEALQEMISNGLKSEGFQPDRVPSAVTYPE